MESIPLGINKSATSWKQTLYHATVQSYIPEILTLICHVMFSFISFISFVVLEFVCIYGQTPYCTNLKKSHSADASVLKFQKIQPSAFDSKALICAWM